MTNLPLEMMARRKAAMAAGRTGLESEQVAAFERRHDRGGCDADRPSELNGWARRGCAARGPVVVDDDCGARFDVALLSMASALLAAVPERQRDIGVLKAIVGRDRDVLRWFLVEALVREERPEMKNSPAGSRPGSSSRMRAEPR